MTCIVGLEHNNRIYIGADSAATGWDRQTIVDWPKVFRNGDFLIGICGSVRMAQLLQYRLDPPPPPEDPRDLHGFMVLDFVDAIKEVFTEGGFGKHPDSDNHSGGTFLVGVRSKIYQLYSDYQVTKSRLGYEACGSGEGYALGSLHTSQQKMKDPKARVLMALEAAATFSSTVAGPYVVESM